MDNLSKRGLLQKAVLQEFGPKSIRDLIDGTDSVTVALRDGRLILARLDREGSLRLDEIDEAC